MKCVFKGQAFEAEIVKGRLEDSGIPAMIQNNTLSAVMSAYSYMSGDLSVMVNPEDEQKAKELLASEPEEITE